MNADNATQDKIETVKLSIEKLESKVAIASEMKELVESKLFTKLITNELFDKEAKTIVNDLATIQRLPDVEKVMLDKLKSIKTMRSYIDNTLAAGVNAENALIKERVYLQELVNASYSGEDLTEIGEYDE